MGNDKSQPGEKINNFKGAAFEWFSVLAYRHAMWRKEKLGSTTIRNAFPREDRPPALVKQDNNKNTKSKTPKQGVDLVINRYHRGSLQDRELVQLKAGKGESNRYLPGVTTINAYSGKPADFIHTLRESAELMKRQCQGERLESKENQTIQESLSLVKPDLLERAA